jgi:galactose-1-phosphate uridylyltransferase
MGMPRDDGRVVVSNEYWAALVPWWAKWPFEILRRSFSHKELPQLMKHIQFFRTTGISNLLTGSAKRKGKGFLTFSLGSRNATITSFGVLFRIQWEFTNDR